MAETPNKHEVKTFEDLLNLVTTENHERLVKDLSKYLLMYAEFTSIARALSPDETKGKTNTQIFNSGFVWVDDGKNDLLSIEVDGQEVYKKP